MACACEFQPVIQVDCVLDILRIIRSGDVLSARAELLQHVGCVVGSLGKYLEGEASIAASAPCPTPCTLEECADELERMLPSQEAASVVAINPALLALLLKIAQLLIEKYLS